AVAAAGHDRVTVSGKPRVAVLPTGSELVSIGSELKAGDILEYNSLVLAAQLVDWGAVPRKYPITPDSLEAICAALQAAALDNDLVLLNAGSSAGAEDYSAQAISRLGRVLVHGVAVRPGHPVILGMLDGPRPVPVLGVPGYPVSAALTAELFVQPLLAVWQGRQPPSRPRVPASLTRKVVSPAGDDDYVRVILGNVGDRLLAAPLPRGAGVITSLSKADGLVVFPRGVQGAEAGQLVEVETLIDTSLFSRTIFCVGSHDMTLDLLAQYLTGKGLRLVSSNVGSLGGLLALKKGEAHLAGCHLMDPETGIYNIAYIHKYLPGIPVMVYGFLDRKQGLMVAGGNPLGIARLEDLVRGDVRFANRQRGAGTRILLDHHLDRLGLPAESIRGYNQEEYTHLGVAVAVASGRADCGLGIPAAAESLGLDFIPLFEETYQLVIPKDLAEGAFLQPLLAILHDQQFQSVVASMPGYGISRMGDLMAEVNDDTGFDYR
ncbi:MAG: molybdopterin biosynthesis protein, partial [Chloroflexi bacterium]|nr:molybdopterin biosynthesis protein [Chloroflexota bacterium]